MESKKLSELKPGELVAIRYTMGVNRIEKVRRVTARFVELEDRVQSRWSVTTGRPYPKKSGRYQPRLEPATDVILEAVERENFRDLLGSAYQHPDLGKLDLEKLRSIREMLKSHLADLDPDDDDIEEDD